MVCGFDAITDLICTFNTGLLEQQNIDFAACFFYFLPSVSLLYSLYVESSLFLSLYVGLDIVQCGQVY